MSEASVPSGAAAPGPTIMKLARTREDVALGDELVRHRMLSRVIHWTVALFFMVALMTGMPIWSPVFQWMAPLFGGLTVCRWLHAWSGVAFSVSTVVMVAHWFHDMKLVPHDLKFNLVGYMQFSSAEDPEIGKYNAGQKLFFWTAPAAMLVVLLSGIPLGGRRRSAPRCGRCASSSTTSGSSSGSSPSSGTSISAPPPSPEPSAR